MLSDWVSWLHGVFKPHFVYSFQESSLLKPIYAFADSRLLFWKKEDGSFFLNDLKQNFDSADVSVAYIGAPIATVWRSITRSSNLHAADSF